MYAAFCDITSHPLTIGRNWYHCPETMFDVTAEVFAELPASEKAKFVRVGQATDLGAEQARYLTATTTATTRCCRHPPGVVEAKKPCDTATRDKLPERTAGDADSNSDATESEEGMMRWAEAVADIAADFVEVMMNGDLSRSSSSSSPPAATGEDATDEIATHEAVSRPAVNPVPEPREETFQNVEQSAPSVMPEPTMPENDSADEIAQSSEPQLSPAAPGEVTTVRIEQDSEAEAVQLLLEMGLGDALTCLRAVRSSGGDVNAAAVALLRARK